MVLTLDGLRELAERLPDGAALTLPKAALVEALGALHTSANPVGELTVEQLAQQLQRSPSTIRTWLELGHFPGAYHLPASGKEDKRGRARVGAWRIPIGALDAFRARDVTPGKAPDKAVNLGAWRGKRRRA